MSKYTLTYFEAKGRAEISRLIFAAAGQEYEDKRIQEFTEPDYQKLMALKEEDRKYSEEWLAFKEKTPFGQVPLLEVDGVPIAQSKVITSFLGKRLGLAGKTDLDEAKVAMIAETTEEVFMSPVFGLFTEKDKEKQAAAVKKIATETIPNLMKRLEIMVGEKGFLVGDQLSYADIALYFNSTWPSFVKDDITSVKVHKTSRKMALFKVEVDWSKYPKLKAVVDNVTSNPGIAKWLKERPNTFF